MSLEKATLRVYDGAGENIEFMFNPSNISLSRSVKWQSEQGNRGNSALPKVNFAGVDPYKLTLSQILFDTYEEQTTVMTYINKLAKGVESPNGHNQRPPVYIFEWGTYSTFPSVITTLSYKLEMFLPDGTPVRALVDISLQEVDRHNLPGNNTSASTGSNRINDNRTNRGTNT
jgi:hypothetical protein